MPGKRQEITAQRLDVNGLVRQGLCRVQNDRCVDAVRQFANAPGIELSDPSEIRVDAAGRVYVLDDAPPMIRVYGDDGALLRTIGREGSGPGEFRGGGMLMLSRDTLVHQDQRQSRAQAFTTDGQLIGQWPSSC